MGDFKPKLMDSKATRTAEGNTSAGTESYMTTIDSMIKGYTDKANQLLGSIGAGVIMPDAGMATPEAIDNYSFNKKQELVRNDAMMWGGLYSQIKTGSSELFFKAMESKGKTADDLMNMKANIDVVINPKASRSSKLISSAYLQRSFGIDPARDYAHINQAQLALDAIKGDIGKTMLAMGENQKSVAMKMLTLGTKDTTKFTTAGTFPALTKSMKEVAEMMEIAESNGDKALVGKLQGTLIGLADKLRAQSLLPMSTAEAKDYEKDNN